MKSFDGYKLNLKYHFDPSSNYTFAFAVIAFLSRLGSQIVKKFLTESNLLSSGQFLEDVRKVMGVPEWMVSVDSRKTRILHSGACIQILLHFSGPDANKLELDFAK